MTVPQQPKIYHIVHADRLQSIIDSNGLLCDAEIVQSAVPGTTIGMNTIKQRRLNELTLTSHPDLYVGDCVPFYFCPRSIMLFLLYKANHPDLAYRGGQDPIIHLEFDLYQSVEWAIQNNKRWAFTLSNAGARYFEDRSNLDQLGEINWDAVHTHYWSDCSEGKQAEFLMEQSYPWHLVERIGVYSHNIYQQVVNTLPTGGHRPAVDVKTEWYY